MFFSYNFSLEKESLKFFLVQAFMDLYQDPSIYQETRETCKEGNSNPVLMFWMIHSLGICMSNCSALLVNLS